MLNTYTLQEAQQALQSKQISSRELTQACLDRIKDVDGAVKAFIGVDEAFALQQAEFADQRLSAGEGDQNPLLGIPIALKDVIAVEGQSLSCGSKILENFVAPYDATVTTKLKQSGAVLLGRANMDEFAMGSSTENSAFGASRNPWDLERVPGGSSGGSAAAIAADECIASVGSDTGGSIRQPASFCGCVGLKPTYGRVSRYGLVAYASSLDQIGPFAKSVGDAATLLQVMAGHDPADSTSAVETVPDFSAGLGGDLKGFTLGVPKEFMVGGLDPETEKAIKAALSLLEGLGATLKEISLPHSEYAVAAYYICATAEASANLARFDGIRYGHRAAGEHADPAILYRKSRGEGFGPEVKRRIILGAHVLSSGYYDAYYLKAQRVRTLIRRDFEKAFKDVDAIVAPTTPTPAFKAGENVDDPLKMYLQDIFTIACNLAGNCGISVPCGFAEPSGLPIGLQVIGDAFQEAKILKVAEAYERSTDWRSRRPKLGDRV